MWTTLIGFVLSKAPWLTASWVKPVCYALVAASLVWSGWHLHGWQYDSDQLAQAKAQLQAQHDLDVQQHAKDVKQHTVDEAILAEAASKRDLYRQQAAALTATLATKTFTETTAQAKATHHEQPVASSPDDCPVVRRNVTYWLCYNAAVNRDAKALAACKAD